MGSKSAVLQEQIRQQDEQLKALRKEYAVSQGDREAMEKEIAASKTASAALQEQQDAHEREMRRLEESHQQQMKALQETLAVTTKALTEFTNAGNIAERPYKEDKATIQDTQNVHRMLEKKRGEFKGVASKLEANIHEAAKSGFDLILSEVENIKSVAGLSIDASAIEQETDNFIRKIDGSIADVINRRVALSDAECTAILEADSADEREQKLGGFLEKVVKESIQKSEERMEEEMLKALKMVSYTVTNKINDKKQELQSAAVELKSLEKALSESEIKQKKEMYKSEIEAIDGFLTTAAGIASAIA